MSKSLSKQSGMECHIESYIGGRSENQDSAGSCNTPLGMIAIVCDGMGGMKGGSTASSIAVKVVMDDVNAASPDDSPADVLAAAIKHANSEIIKAAHDDEELMGMGTTLTAVILNDDCATVAYVGDSRVYQLRGTTKVFRTFDHSLVFQSVRLGIITEEQARLSSQSNIILQALGIKEDVNVETYELPYLSGDRFILCTDGFWGAMPEKEFIDMVARGRVPEVLKKAALKIDLLGIRQGGNHDNLTAAMFDVNKESKKKANMTAKIKMIFCLLITLLVASLALNICQYTGVFYNESADVKHTERPVESKTDTASVKTIPLEQNNKNQ